MASWARVGRRSASPDTCTARARSNALLERLVKGIGFFLGGVLLEELGFTAPLWVRSGIAVCGTCWVASVRAQAHGQ